MKEHYIVAVLIHAVYAQFPTHTDLQKVGEVILNNEKYNILKPRVHTITDHFKDFMLRRENRNPNERIFIDDNGFRHFWSGFGRKHNSLRKTEISFYEMNKNIKNHEKPIRKDNDLNTSNEETRKTAMRKKPKRPKTSIELDMEEKAFLRTAKPAATVKPAATTKKAAAATTKKAAAATTKKAAAATTKSTAAKAAAVTTKAAAATTKAAAGTSGGKKVAKVSFFCPFFGVMTMTSFIE